MTEETAIESGPFAPEIVQPLDNEPEVEEVEERTPDIDPRQWLSTDVGELVESVKTSAGWIKVAAITEGEFDVLNRASERIDPKNPRGGKKLNLMAMRHNVVAYSINKAHGWITPAGQVTPEGIQPAQLKSRPAGEVSMLQKKIYELSGFVTPSQNEQIQDFFD